MLARVQQFLENPTDVWTAEFINAIDLDDPSRCFPIFVSPEGTAHVLSDLLLGVLLDDSLFLLRLFPLAPGLLTAFRDGSCLLTITNSAVGAFAPLVVQMTSFKQAKIKDLIFL